MTTRRDNTNDGRSEGAGETLCPQDAAALDALMEAGFRIEAVPAALQARAERLCGLLGCMDAPTVKCDADRMATRVLDRLHGSRHSQTERAAEKVQELTLSPLDEDAMESLVGAGYDAAKVAKAVRPRAERQVALFRLLDTPVAGLAAGRETLVARTLAKVQWSIDRNEERMVMSAREGTRSRFRIADLAAVAAVLIIGTALLLPMMNRTTEAARLAACQGQLGNAALAFTMYAAANGDELPMATASLAGLPWWNVGKAEQSNSANLFTLSRQCYIPLEALACPGNANGVKQPHRPDAMDWASLPCVSYSYQNQFSADRSRWGYYSAYPKTVVLADKSPVVPRAIAGRAIDPWANSDNHHGVGQFVLFNDASSAWMTTPLTEDGDNIWLPRSVERVIKRVAESRGAVLKGTEEPGGLGIRLWGRDGTLDSRYTLSMPVFRITKTSIEALPETTFATAGVKERGDLQRLLKANIAVVAPDVMVIAEEFAEWEDSKRRIDLLGVDRDGNVVVIELKRDDDSHMELQAIRYAAMVSGMTFSRAVEVYQDLLDANGEKSDARARLLEFLGWDEPREDHFAQDVRIVLVAANFSKELTTAVLWLNERQLDVRCVRLRPYTMNGEVIVDVQQVVPLPEAEAYTVQIKQKVQAVRQAKSDRHELRLAFWKELLPLATKTTPRFAGMSPTSDNWIAVSAGMPGCRYAYLLWQDIAGGEVYIDKGTDSVAWNKAVFDYLFARKEDIEKAYGAKLAWYRLDEKRASRIMEESIKGGIKSPREDWPRIRDEMIDSMRRMELVLGPHLKKAIASVTA